MLEPILVNFKSSIIWKMRTYSWYQFSTFYGDRKTEENDLYRSKHVALFLEIEVIPLCYKYNNIKYTPSTQL